MLHVTFVAIMISMQDQLYGFKCSMRKDYDTLATKERELSSEVCVFVLVSVLVLFLQAGD